MASSYKAFISYSHADERWAKWLQRSLEHYRLPKRLSNDVLGQTLPKRLYPVFRDRSELSSSSNLAGSLHESLKNSENLIVICSPAAANSHWINEEIKYFQSLGRSDRIFCLMVDGEPYSNSDQCAFPPALLQSDETGTTVEHLAADIREDGKRDALLKIIGGILQVGIDALKQRDAQRRVRVFASIATGSALLAVAMVILSIFAFTAKQESELRRGQAENLIGFMLGDLRGKLTPIGRLDILDAVGDEAMEYFEKLDDNATPKDLLSRAMALRQIGEVRFNQGQLEPALQSFYESRNLLLRLFKDNESNNDYLFELGQSEFWVGYVHYERAQLPEALEGMENYLRISRDLLEREPENTDYLSELAYAYSNMGSVARASGDLQSAIEQFAASVVINEQQLLAVPDDQSVQTDLAGGYSWIGSATLDSGDLIGAELAYQKALDVWTGLANNHDNARYRELAAHAKVFLALSKLFLGNVEDASQLSRLGFDEFVELTKQDAANDRWLRGRATAARNLAETLYYQGQIEEAQILMLSAVADFRQLTISDSSNVDNRSQYAVTLAHFAVLKRARGDLDAALQASSNAYDEMKQLLASENALRTTEDGAALVYSVHSLLLDDTGQHDQAAKAREEILVLIQKQQHISLIVAAQIIPVAQKMKQEKFAASLAARLAESDFNHPAYR